MVSPKIDMQKTKSLCLGLLLAFASALSAQTQHQWHVAKTLHIGGEGGWDYLTVDPETHRLFVPRSTHTMVIDSVSGKTLADIPGQKIAHGVALVPQVGRGFITDGGGDGAIVVFDLKTYKVLGSLAAQPDADGIIFDQASGLVMAVSGDKGLFMTFKPDIDPKNGKIDMIDLGGAPEFLASDGAGKVYINLEDKNQVAVVNVSTRKVENRWSVAPGGSPVGMSIDVARKRIYIGCRKPQKLIVMSAENGKVVADLPIGEGVDATKADGNQIFASCRDGKLMVAREISPGKFAIAQTVSTPAGARTMGLDTETKTLYLPTAELEMVNGKSKAKAGTFMIVVVTAQ